MKRIASFSALFSLSIALPAVSGTCVWTGAGDGTTWTDAANWDADAVPGAADDVVFPDTLVAALTVSLGTDALEVGSITSLAPVAVKLGSAATPALACADYVLGEGAASLTVAANQALTYTCECTVAADATLSFTYVSGTGDLVKNGPGTLEFLYKEDGRTGGATTVNEGTLLFGNKNQLGSALTVGDGTHDAIVYCTWGQSWNCNHFFCNGHAQVVVNDHGVLDLQTKSNTNNTSSFSIDNFCVEAGGAFHSGSFNILCNGNLGYNYVRGTFTSTKKGILGLTSSWLVVPDTHVGRVEYNGTVRSQYKYSNGALYGRLDVGDIPDEPVDLWFKGPLISAWDSRDGFDKYGAGTLRLSSGASTFGGRSPSMGQLRIYEGTVLCDNESGNATGLSTVRVYPGATLGGTGFLCCPTATPTYSGEAANMTNAVLYATGSSTAPAVIAPGSVDEETGTPVYGTLSIGGSGFNSSVSLGAYSTLRIATGADDACDALAVTGTLDLAAADTRLEVTVSPDTDGGVYTIVSATEGIHGSFAETDLTGFARIRQTETAILLDVPFPGTVLIVQ